MRRLDRRCKVDGGSKVKTVGLRYLNFFGTRQDPNGAYAAVIPLWIRAMLKGEDVYVNGNGKTSRDFCYIYNCVQANRLAACTTDGDDFNQVFNVALGAQTTLNELYALIRDRVLQVVPNVEIKAPIYRDFRKGDVRHSLADISKGKRLIGYEPEHTVKDGLCEAAKWYVEAPF